MGGGQSKNVAENEGKKKAGPAADAAEREAAHVKSVAANSGLTEETVRVLLRQFRQLNGSSGWTLKRADLEGNKELWAMPFVAQIFDAMSKKSGKGEVEFKDYVSFISVFVPTAGPERKLKALHYMMARHEPKLLYASDLSGKRLQPGDKPSGASYKPGVFSRLVLSSSESEDALNKRISLARLKAAPSSGPKSPLAGAAAKAAKAGSSKALDQPKAPGKQPSKGTVAKLRTGGAAPPASKKAASSPKLAKGKGAGSSAKLTGKGKGKAASSPALAKGAGSSKSVGKK